MRIFLTKLKSLRVPRSSLTRRLHAIWPFDFSVAIFLFFFRGPRLAIFGNVSQYGVPAVANCIATFVNIRCLDVLKLKRSLMRRFYRDLVIVSVVAALVLRPSYKLRPSIPIDLNRNLRLRIRDFRVFQQCVSAVPSFIFIFVNTRPLDILKYKNRVADATQRKVKCNQRRLDDVVNAEDDRTDAELNSWDIAALEAALVSEFSLHEIVSSAYNFNTSACVEVDVDCIDF